jgi:ElaB/YqjD/DUF883 family membrane-anchored ribosome-binding protein
MAMEQTRTGYQGGQQFGAHQQSGSHQSGSQQSGGQGRGEQVSGAIQQAYRQTEDLVRENPATSTLVTFGVGFGLGLMLTMLLSPPPRRSSWYDRYSPDRLKDQISDAVSRMLPDAISRHL